MHEVLLSGKPPWGFRISGGNAMMMPIFVSKVRYKLKQSEQIKEFHENKN